MNLKYKTVSCKVSFKKLIKLFVLLTKKTLKNNFAKTAKDV